MSITRREFVTTGATAAAGLTIVPRHVLGRGFQAPSDTVNVAAVGINGMGAVNTQGVMSQNVVAICDCDLNLLDGKLAEWAKASQAAPPQPRQPASPPTSSAVSSSGDRRRRSTTPTGSGLTRTVAPSCGASSRIKPPA